MSLVHSLCQAIRRTLASSLRLVSRKPKRLCPISGAAMHSRSFLIWMSNLVAPSYRLGQSFLILQH